MEGVAPVVTLGAVTLSRGHWRHSRGGDARKLNTQWKHSAAQHAHHLCVGLPSHRNSSTVDDQRGSPPTVVRGKARGVGGIACEFARGIDARFWMASLSGLLVFIFCLLLAG